LRGHYRLHLFCRRHPLRYFGYALAAALLPLYFLIFHVSYRKDRILAFLNPYADPKGFGFHIIQSLIAVSTGGVHWTWFDGREAEIVLSSRAAY
jgi:cell division protein FtsW